MIKLGHKTKESYYYEFFDRIYEYDRVGNGKAEALRRTSSYFHDSRLRRMRLCCVEAAPRRR